jgi:K+-sensing histidine kinase KdpD
MRSQPRSQPRSEEPWSEYIGPFTHELRQEVSAVLHQVELLKSTSIDETTRRRSLDAIEDNAENLMVFVDDLARLHRLARGDVTVSCREVDIEDLLTSSAQDRTRPLRCLVQGDGSAEAVSTHADPVIVDHVVTGLLDRFDRHGLDADVVVNAWAARSSEGCIDVVFSAERQRPTEPVGFRSATVDDGLDLYVARRTAELVGGDVGVLKSGRRDCFLLRLPDGPPPSNR